MIHALHVLGASVHLRPHAASLTLTNLCLAVDCFSGRSTVSQTDSTWYVIDDAQGYVTLQANET